MKRSSNKELNIVTILVVLAMAFLWIFTFVYAYFTATHTINDNYQFANIDVKFSYTTSSGTSTINNKGTIELQPSTIVRRGEEFGLTYNSQSISSLGFSIGDDSCTVYIRYWIDAYKYNDDGSLDTSVNYGKYFSPRLMGNSRIYINRTLGENSNSYDNNIYYVENVLDIYNPDVMEFDSLVLDVNCDTNLIGSAVKITISFEAVQAANKAYEQEFNDEKGYPSWLWNYDDIE